MCTDPLISINKWMVHNQPACETRRFLLYGRANLQGLGYGWTDRSIEYIIGLIDGEIDGPGRAVELPDTGWVTVRGKTAALGEIYERIYQEGRLKYEIERFTDRGDCEIMYDRSPVHGGG